MDITCDSDGKVNRFIDLQDVRDTLPLHALSAGEPYYLGFFLMGAYQDIMGDLHNLFGRVNEVHLFLDEDEESGYYIEEVIEGSTIAQVLSLTQWEQNELIRRMKTQVDAAIKSDRLKPNEAMKLLSHYERGLQAVEELKKIVPPGATLAQFALRWILMFDAVTCAIPGAKRPAQVEENAAASDLPPLTAAQMKTVEDVYNKYCRAQVHQRW